MVIDGGRGGGGKWKRAKGGQMEAVRDFILGGEHTMQYIDDVYIIVHLKPI